QFCSPVWSTAQSSRSRGVSRLPAQVCAGAGSARKALANTAAGNTPGAKKAALDRKDTSRQERPAAPSNGALTLALNPGARVSRLQLPPSFGFWREFAQLWHMPAAAASTDRRAVLASGMA